MTDRISLRGISARGFHGVLDFEKVDGQTFVVDVDLEVDLDRAAGTDDLAHTVSYADVAADVVALVAGPSVDLIEVLAGAIADAALSRPLVQAVDVTVHKPQAPVGVPFTDVAVSLRRERDVPVVIALGANLGDLRGTLEAAVDAIGRVDGIQVTGVSPLVETDPVGGPEQPCYLNAVVLARTRLAAYPLLAALHRIEADHGRRRDIRWGARTLDLDLIQYGDPVEGTDQVSDDPVVTLPHPRAALRAFVLVPWSRLDGEAALRVGGQVLPVAQILTGLDQSGVRPGPDWGPTW